MKFSYIKDQKLRSKMPPTCIAMTIRKNGINFIIRYTSTNNLIRTYFPNVRFIPYIILRVILILFFFALFKSLGNFPVTMRFTILANQGSLPYKRESYSSRSVSEIVNDSFSSTSLLMWSTTKLSAPLQSLISKLNFFNKRI